MKLRNETKEGEDDMTDTMKKGVNFEKVYKWIFVLMCAFSVMPWFDFAPAIMPAYWGVGMLQYFVIPFVYIFYLIWAQEEKIGWIQLLLGEIAYFAVLAGLGYTFFHWMDLIWIAESTDLRVSMEKSLPPFWICCFFSLCGAVLFPVYVRKRNIAQG